MSLLCMLLMVAGAAAHGGGHSPSSHYTMVNAPVATECWSADASSLASVCACVICLLIIVLLCVAFRDDPPARDRQREERVACGMV